MESEKKLNFVEYLLCVSILISTYMCTIAFKTEINIYCLRTHNGNSWIWEYVFFCTYYNTGHGININKFNLIGCIKFKIYYLKKYYD